MANVDKSHQKGISLILSTISEFDDLGVFVMPEPRVILVKGGLYQIKASSFYIDGKVVAFHGNWNNPPNALMEACMQTADAIQLNYPGAGTWTYMDRHSQPTVYNHHYYGKHPSRGPISAPLQAVVFLPNSPDDQDTSLEELVRRLSGYSKGFKIPWPIREHLRKLLERVQILHYAELERETGDERLSALRSYL